MTDLKIGDLVMVPWGKSIGVITSHTGSFYIVKFILHYDDRPNKDGGYIKQNLIKVS